MRWCTFKSQHTISLNKAILSIIIAQKWCEQLFHWRLSAGKLFVEITWSEMAVNASRAMLNNYIHLTYLFKLQTMQHLFLVYKSQRRFKLQQSYNIEKYTLGLQPWSVRVKPSLCIFLGRLRIAIYKELTKWPRKIYKNFTKVFIFPKS